VKSLRKLRYGLEYLALRAGLAFIECVPLRAATWAASSLGGIYFRANARRRTLAEDNIRRAGVAVQDEDAHRIARASFRHMGLVAVESVKFARAVTKDNWRSHLEFAVSQQTMDMLRDDRQALIIASGHLGNWEIAAQAVGFICPITGIARDMNNPYVNRLIKQRSSRQNFNTIPKGSGGHALLSALRGGEALAILVDQHARTSGMMIDFFGQPASTHTSPARLHLATGAPLLVGYCLRTGPLAYRITITDPISFTPTGNKQGDVKAILEQLNAVLEDAIRRFPEQYLWAHRRWRY